MRRRIDANAICNFYYRRARRILPLYASVLLVVLIVCTLLVDIFEYRRIINLVALPSLFFVSNVPALHAISYFDLVGGRSGEQATKEKREMSAKERRFVFNVSKNKRARLKCEAQAI